MPSPKHDARGVTGVSIALIALIATSTAAAHQAVTLRWRFEEGKHLVYRMTTSQETEMPDDAGVLVAENAMTMSWDVVEVNGNGDASVRITTDRVQMNVQTPMGIVTADSEADPPSSDPIARSATALAGTSYTMVFDDSGQVRDVQGLEEMRERLLGATGQQGNPMTEQLLDQIASEDGVRNMLGRGVAQFPPEPLEAGDSWDASFDLDVPMLGAMTNTSIMTLDRVESRDGERVAYITMSGDMIFTPSESAGTTIAGSMRIGDATISGDMEWNVDRGILLRSSSRTVLEMEVMAGSRQMNLVMTMDQRLELVDQ